ncbi:hypothetical protein AB0R12_01980 [Streptomyces niveus]|uniref:hypothetical protein n=1 Tax=Streptomyces niveus TaxID=193462 RepID=UPI00341FA31D
MEDEVPGKEPFAGRGIARHWLAVTDQRIGAGLDLLDATGTTLPREDPQRCVSGTTTARSTAAFRAERAIESA